MGWIGKYDNYRPSWHSGPEQLALGWLPLKSSSRGWTKPGFIISPITEL